MKPEQLIDRYTKLNGKQPPIQWLAGNAKISTAEAERLLSQGELFNEQAKEQIITQKATEKPIIEAPKEVKSDIPAKKSRLGWNRKKGDVSGRQGRDDGRIEGPTPELGIIDRLVVKFIGGIKSFVFLSASLGDLALTVFFYISIGFDMPSKIAMGIWALTQTLGKIYLWHMRLDKGAIFAAALSVVATVSIVLAVADTQSVQAVANNNVVKSAIVISLEDQIKAKGEENKVLQERLANTPPDYVGASRTITNTIKSNDEALQGLREELNKVQEQAKVIERPKFELSTWIIFSQFTNFKWSDPSHIFAFVLILGIAVFFEVLIRATTPRKLKV